MTSKDLQLFLNYSKKPIFLYQILYELSFTLQETGAGFLNEVFLIVFKNKPISVEIAVHLMNRINSVGAERVFL